MDHKEILKIATEFIAKWEGFVSTPYFCSGWAITIGYGHIIESDGVYGHFIGKDLIRVANEIKNKYSDNGHTEQERNQINAEIAKRFKNIITENDAMENLKHQVRVDYWQKINKFLPRNLNSNQYAAIISLTYNIGVTALAKSTLLRKIKQGDLRSAEGEFLRWVYADGQKVRGLQNRRADEVSLFKKIPTVAQSIQKDEPTYYDPIPPMRFPTVSNAQKIKDLPQKSFKIAKENPLETAAIALGGAVVVPIIAEKTGLDSGTVNHLFSILVNVLSGFF